jgi:hypothetical protein
MVVDNIISNDFCKKYGVNELDQYIKDTTLGYANLDLGIISEKHLELIHPSPDVN